MEKIAKTPLICTAQLKTFFSVQKSPIFPFINWPRWVLVSFFLDFSLLNKVLDALSRSSRYRQPMEFIGNQAFVAGGISQFPRENLAQYFGRPAGRSRYLLL